MRKKLAWTAAVGVFVALGFFAAIVIGGRRANHPGMASSPDRKPPAGEALSRVAESPGVRSGRPGGDSEAPVFGKNERNPALPVRLDGPDRREERVPREPRAAAGLEDPSPVLAGGGLAFKISGKVSFGGPAPKVKLNRQMASDPMCAMLHAEPPPKDDFVVSPEGGVRWAFVYIKKGLEGRLFHPPAEPVTIQQEGCTYAPHVAGVMVGQALIFHNSDPLLHNVHGLPFVNKEFNFGQPRGALNRMKPTSSEIMVKVICDIHPWMGAWVGVLDHPFFAVTDGFGNFTLDDVPAGKYTLAVWHEKLRFTDQELLLTRDHLVDFSSALMK